MRDKQVLRGELKSWRRSLDDAQAARLSKAAMGILMGLIPWPDVKSLHTYLPLPGEHEMDTHEMVDTITRQYLRVRLATWQQSRGEAAVSQWIDGSKSPERLVPPGFRFDVVIVPVLGFTKDCHRLGFGGGFYDRFLASQPEALTIGLAYEDSRTDFKPEPHDISLDAIVTERSVYRAPDNNLTR